MMFDEIAQSNTTAATFADPQVADRFGNRPVGRFLAPRYRAGHEAAAVCDMLSAAPIGGAWAASVGGNELHSRATGDELRLMMTLPRTVGLGAEVMELLVIM